MENIEGIGLVPVMSEMNAFAVLVRVVAAIFAIFVALSALVGIIDPALGSSDSPPPTRGDAILRAIPMLIYALALAPSPFRLGKLWFWIVCSIRFIGFIPVAIATVAIFWQQATTWIGAALLLMFPISVVLVPAALALWELYAARRLHSTAPG